jgi:insulysin
MSTQPVAAPASTAVGLPIKLETPSLDHREYCVVPLPNQLEVLLVHDPDTDKATAALDCNVGTFSNEETCPAWRMLWNM